MRTTVLAFLVAITSVSACLAQRPSNIVTRCALSVYVQQTNERALADGIHVRLYQRGQILVAESVTDERGRATFSELPSGYYHVEVYGVGISPTTGSEFEIIDNEGSHTEMVRVRPAVDADSQTPAPGTQATVSAAQLTIPEKAQKEFDKGVEAFSAGETKKAEDSFKRAIQEYPKFANAYSNLGVLYVKTGQQPKAREAFTQAITVDDNFVPGYINLARLAFATHDYADAEAKLTRALSLAPDNMDALALMATTAYLNKQNETALANVRHLHSLPNHQDYAGVHLIAAQILLSQNERAQAVDQYIAFLQESPNDLRVPAVRKTLAEMKAGKQ